MADRFNWYFKQLVTEAQMDEAFLNMEEADENIVADSGIVGVVTIGSMSQAGTPSLNIIVAPTTAYDQSGQRMSLAGSTTLDVSQDSLAVSTAVTGAGNEKWLTVLMEFERAASDPQTDGNSQLVDFRTTESARLVVIQGAEAPTGTAGRPAAGSNQIILGDIRREFGVTTIVNANIDTSRRQMAFGFTASTFQAAPFQPAKIGDALQALANLVGNFGGADGAENLGIAVANQWRDNTGIAGTNVDSAIEEIVSDLASSTTNVKGSGKIGHNGEGITWADGSSPGGLSVGDYLNSIVGGLAEDAAGFTGAAKIGFDTSTTWLNAGSVGADNVEGAIDEIVSDLRDTLGARRIGQNRPELVGDNSSVQGALDTLATSWAKLSRENTFSAAQRFNGILRLVGNKIEFGPASTASHFRMQYLTADNVTSAGTVMLTLPRPSGNNPGHLSVLVIGLTSNLGSNVQDNVRFEMRASVFGHNDNGAADSDGVSVFSVATGSADPNTSVKILSSASDVQIVADAGPAQTVNSRALVIWSSTETV